MRNFFGGDRYPQSINDLDREAVENLLNQAALAGSTEIKSSDGRIYNIYTLMNALKVIGENDPNYEERTKH